MARSAASVIGDRPLTITLPSNIAWTQAGRNQGIVRQTRGIIMGDLSDVLVVRCQVKRVESQTNLRYFRAPW